MNKVFILKAFLKHGLTEEYYGASSSREELEDIVEVHKYNIDNGIIDSIDDYDFEIVEIEHNLSNEWFKLSKQAVKSNIQVVVDIVSKADSSGIEDDWESRKIPLFAYNKSKPNLKFKFPIYTSDCPWFG